MVPKRECPTLESILAVAGVEAPGQLRLPSRDLGGAFFLHADIGIIPETTLQVATRQEFESLLTSQ